MAATVASIKARCQKILERFAELEKQSVDVNLMKDRRSYSTIMKEHAHLSNIKNLYEHYCNNEEALEDNKKILDNEKDEEMLNMVKQEIEELSNENNELIEKIKIALIPPDPLATKNIIMEIRAGTGGDESALFAADLFRMYSRYAESRKWKIEVINFSESSIGGFKEVIFTISGKNVYENLCYESGVHRVQRIPATESGGRIHTSAVTVAVLPEVEETEIEINPDDIKIDVFRSSGPGGQSVNTTDSAVRITHISSGIVVSCQDEKSQIKNRAKAMKVLRARLFEAEQAKKQQERAKARRSQVGTGDRSERIRTYNFPQNRLTDHRINLTLYSLETVIAGEINEVIEALKLTVREELLA